MEGLDRLNAAMDYLEAHLADEIAYERAAQIACCSTYHFQRMFSYIAGVPLSEYIRRRRLTLAAFELQAGSCREMCIRDRNDTHRNAGGNLFAQIGAKPLARLFPELGKRLR